jgi:hypothetical protein
VRDSDDLDVRRDSIQQFTIDRMGGKSRSMVSGKDLGCPPIGCKVATEVERSHPTRGSNGWKIIGDEESPSHLTIAVRHNTPLHLRA